MNPNSSKIYPKMSQIMEVDNKSEGIVFNDNCKLNFTTADVYQSDMFTLQPNNVIKTEVPDSNFVTHAVAQTLPQMVTLTPDQNGIPGSSGLPVGAVMSMAVPNSASQDQVFFTLQQVGCNGNIIDSGDIGKPDFSQPMSHMMSPSLTNMNDVTQLVSGNYQTIVNLQSLQGFDGMPQLTPMGVPGGFSNLGNFNQNALLPTRTTNGTISQVMEMAFQSMPQTVNVPQFMLSNGQLIQNVPGMNQLNQLYIPQQPSQQLQTTSPSSSSIIQTGPQQILTIPINQMPNNSGPFTQMVQLMMPNGQIITTSVAGLQALTNQQQMVNQVQHQTMMNNNVQSLSLPQIVTNSSGQILAVSPQLIGQSPGLVQVYTPNTSGQLQIDIQPQQQQQILQTDNYPALTKSVQTSMNNGSSVVMPNQAAQIQISTVGDTTQVTNQTIVTQRPVTTPTQVVQVAQTSSPSITSTESSTPISQTNANTVDGINLEEIKEFAKAFKIRRLSLGLTQTQVGQALSITEGPAYSQSAICRFEKLDITPKSAQRIKPVLEHWMHEAEERYKNGSQNLTDFIGIEPSKKRKRRTSFTPQALEVLAHHFDKNTHPTGAEMTELACKLNYEREVVRVWFCNKRQTLKNTVNKKLKSVNQ